MPDDASSADDKSSLHSEISFLTLGDGDFTYSLDLARYFVSSLYNGSDDSRKHERIKLTATGIDSLDELKRKYKDSPFILDQLQLVHPKPNTSPLVSVAVKHGVNAIVFKGSEKPSSIEKADHVMFHHPHLGTEDATLHGRFLCHFFDTCVQHWMKPKEGLIHLTLVQGQYERWKCLESAEKQGLYLLERVSFVPPPPGEPHPPTYHYRRHQTGKSFDSRRPKSSSETFTFGRIMDKAFHDFIGLPWQKTLHTTASNIVPESNTSNGSDTRLPLECPYCDKVFREERSRKCHVRDKHPNGADKKARIDKGMTSESSWTCPHCALSTGEPRNFVSKQALQDHQTAKHRAMHDYIVPDWHGKVKANLESSSSPYFSDCPICGARFQDKVNENRHSLDFVPTSAGSPSFECSFCSKAFRENRAMLQHENFCSAGKDTS